MRVRGLKWQLARHREKYGLVAPHAGAWIEIALWIVPDAAQGVAPHAGAWIEIQLLLT